MIIGVRLFVLWFASVNTRQQVLYDEARKNETRKNEEKTKNSLWLVLGRRRT
jgi:heme exporter protein D